MAQNQPHVEHWIRRSDEQWLVSTKQGLDEDLMLTSIECVLQLNEIYERVGFLE